MYDQGSAGVAAGWYDDPTRPGTKRYWDGNGWTEHTADGYPVAGAAGQPGVGRASGVYAPYQRTATSRPKPSFVHANQQSLVAIAFAAGYFVLARTTGVVMLGIIPAMAGFRAMSRKEALAPVAIVVAVLAVLLGLGIAGR